MADKKKGKKKTKKSAGRKAMPAKKRTQKQAVATKSAKKAPAKKSVAKKKPSKKTAGARTAPPPPTRIRNRSQQLGSSAFSREKSGSRLGEQSGDLQGLSDVETADSESVDELLEEGNAFEAGVVGGVEDAGEHDGGEVHTHEVPEDDVPGEYLDEE